MIRSIIAIVLFLGIGIWLLYNIISSLRSGAINARGYDIKRKEKPGMYWSTLLSQTVFCILVFLGLFLVLNTTFF